MQFRLNAEFSDSKWILLLPSYEKFISFPELNFLTISYIIEDCVVVLPSSRIFTSLIL